MWALANSRALGWFVALSAFANAAAVSPLANRADGLSVWLHYGQHVVIVAASIVLGSSLRDLSRARPLAPRGLVALGLTGAAAFAAVALPAVRDESATFHFAQHALVVVAAAIAGVVLRDVVLTRENARAGAACDLRSVPLTGSVGEAWRAIAGSWFPLAAVLAGAVYVRVASLGFQSLSGDEGYSFALAQRSFTGMLGLFRWEGNGTLYSLALWPLVRVSDSIDVLRLPAALAGVAAVGATYWAGRELANRRIALVGAFLLAISPMALRYAQFARPFSFVLLFSALSFALLARHLRTGGKPALIGYAVVLSLAAYSNTLAPVLLVPAHALLVAPGGWSALRRLTAGVAGALLLAGPLIALTYAESGRRDPLYWLTSPDLGAIARVAQEFMIGRAPSDVAVVRAASVAAILATGFLIAAVALRADRARLAPPLVAWVFVPIVVALAISQVRPVFFDAYLIVLLPGLCLLLAAGATHLRARLSVGVVGVLALAWLVADAAMSRPPLVNDYRSAAAWIASQRSAGEPLILDPVTTLPGYAYYDSHLRAANGYIVVKEWREQPMPAGVTGFTDPGGYGDAPAGPPSARLVSRLARRTGRLVLVIDATFGQGDVEEGAAATWLRRNCAVREGHFGGIVVLAARRCRPAPSPAAS